MLKKPTMKQKGLKKLPEQVRNKMGFMDKGGPVITQKKEQESMSSLQERVADKTGMNPQSDAIQNMTRSQLLNVFKEKKQDGGRVGAADMSAKKTSSPKKKQMPKYYMGGGAVKQGKMYSYGGRVAKYKD